MSYYITHIYTYVKKAEALVQSLEEHWQGFQKALNNNNNNNNNKHSENI
jgi:hypothetical protein